ncbi:hypothetical protein THAOC_28485, partial [Thalassiosira oceanica]
SRAIGDRFAKAGRHGRGRGEALPPPSRGRVRPPRERRSVGRHVEPGGRVVRAQEARRRAEGRRRRELGRGHGQPEVPEEEEHVEVHRERGPPGGGSGG